jgi:hypothetical protein
MVRGSVQVGNTDVSDLDSPSKSTTDDEIDVIQKSAQNFGNPPDI